MKDWAESCERDSSLNGQAVDVQLSRFKAKPSHAEHVTVNPANSYFLTVS